MSFDAKASEYLLELLRCGVNRITPCEKPEDVSWEAVYAFAKRHSVSALAYEAVRHRMNELPSSIAEAWEEQNAKLLTKYFNQEHELTRLCDTFEREKIPYMPLKGSCIRQFFPSPETREMCDLDILVPPEFEEKTHNILLAKGYSYIVSHTTSHNREYHKAPYLNIEMHTALYPQECAESAYFNDVWTRAERCGDSYAYRLSWNDFFVFAIAHTYKHYYRIGTGIRSVLDIYVMKKALREQFDEVYIRTELKKLSMLTFYETISELAESWFSPDHPAPAGAVEEMAHNILCATTYGVNQGAVQNAVAGYMRRGKSVSGAKISVTIRKIFPSRAFMKSMYPMLEKSPLLLPLCWIARGFRILFTEPQKLSKFFRNLRKKNMYGKERK